jgi:hypothetical protein
METTAKNASDHQTTEHNKNKCKTQLFEGKRNMTIDHLTKKNFHGTRYQSRKTSEIATTAKQQ